MKARVNTFALQQTVVESSSLAVLGMVAHPLPDEGNYQGTVYRGGSEVATFNVSVDADFKDRQADVDLSALAPHRRRQREAHKAPDYSLAPESYLLLYVSQGPGGFSVRLDKLGKGKPKRVFDTRNLRKGDLFVASLLRPGTYEMTNRSGEGKGQITVAYPEAGKKPYLPSPPETVVVTEKGFKPSKVKVGAAQGVVFNVEADKSAIAVSLAKPDDGPRQKGERDKFRWQKPGERRR